MQRFRNVVTSMSSDSSMWSGHHISKCAMFRYNKIHAHQAELSDLAAALKRHRENNISGDLLGTSDVCTWADVLDEMSRAEEEYFSQGRGSKNIGRRSLRKVGDYASAISPWFSLIPDDNGMNVLSGGLRLVFQVSISSKLKNSKLNVFADRQRTIRSPREDLKSIPRFCNSPRHSTDEATDFSIQRKLPLMRIGLV